MRERGQATIEAATSILAFLTILLAVVEGGSLLQAWVAVQHSCRVVADTVVTGQGEIGAQALTAEAETKRYPSGAGVWRCQAIKAAARKALLGLRGISTGAGGNPRIEVRYCRDEFDAGRTQSTVDGCLAANPAQRESWPLGPGGPCDVVWVRNRYVYRPLFGSFIMGAGAAACGKTLACQQLAQNADFGLGGCDSSDAADGTLSCP